MKKNIFLTLVFTMVVSVIFAGGSRDIKNVEPSGKIVIYTSMYEHVIESVKQNLNRQFPQIEIEFVYGGTETIQNRINFERSLGKLGCDILLVAEPAYSQELKENGMLHSYMSAERVNLAFDYDSEGYWYPVRISNMVLAYNPERNARNTIPSSFFDFANNVNVKNAISMRSPLTSGTSMASIIALRDKYGYEYFNALSRQNIHIEYSSDNLITKLESGEYKVIMILEESILRKRQEGSNQNGSKLEVIYPTDGIIMIPSTIMIVNDRWSANRNTAAAEAISDWFLSEDGQNTIVDGWMHSVRTDFPRIPYDSKPTDVIRAGSLPVNWENYFIQKKETQDRFQEYLANRDYQF